LGNLLAYVDVDETEPGHFRTTHAGVDERLGLGIHAQGFAGPKAVLNQNARATGVLPDPTSVGATGIEPVTPCL
jgi:hypothetical protein